MKEQFSLSEVTKQCKKEYFPLFISSKGKSVLVVGGGKIATRRVLTLLKFDFDITVVAPTISEKLLNIENITLFKKNYDKNDLENKYFVLAATNDNVLNEEIRKDAKKNGVIANICDDKEKCDFYFPGIGINNDFIVGITGNGKSHKALSKFVKKIKDVMEDEN